MPLRLHLSAGSVFAQSTAIRQHLIEFGNRPQHDSDDTRIRNSVASVWASCVRRTTLLLYLLRRFRPAAGLFTERRPRQNNQSLLERDDRLVWNLSAYHRGRANDAL